MQSGGEEIPPAPLPPIDRGARKTNFPVSPSFFLHAQKPDDLNMLTRTRAALVVERRQTQLCFACPPSKQVVLPSSPFHPPLPCIKASMNNSYHLPSPHSPSPFLEKSKSINQTCFHSPSTAILPSCLPASPSLPFSASATMCPPNPASIVYQPGALRTDFSFLPSIPHGLVIKSDIA